MDKAGKAAAIADLKTILADSGSVIVARYTGLDVAEMTRLRGMLREQGASAKVVKNRLVRHVLGDSGAANDAAAALFVDQTVIAYAGDPVAAAKGVADYAGDNDRLVIVGGLMDGKVLDKGMVEALARLPSLDQLRGQLIGLIQAPATKIAGVLQAPARQLARVMAAYADKDAA